MLILYLPVALIFFLTYIVYMGVISLGGDAPRLCVGPARLQHDAWFLHCWQRLRQCFQVSFSTTLTKSAFFLYSNAKENLV